MEAGQEIDDDPIWAAEPRMLKETATETPRATLQRKTSRHLTQHAEHLLIDLDDDPLRSVPPSPPEPCGQRTRVGAGRPPPRGSRRTRRRHLRLSVEGPRAWML